MSLNFGFKYFPCSPKTASIEKVEEPYLLQLFIVRLMARTYAFLDQLLVKDQIDFVETYPFQSPVRNILKMLGSEEDRPSYINQFTDVVSCASPMLVYFDHPNSSDRIVNRIGIAEPTGPGKA